MGNKVLVCGQYGGEITYIAERHPRFGMSGALRAAGESVKLGGDGYRIADALHQLGVPVRAAGVVGTDPRGKKLRAQFEEWGVDCQYLTRDKRRITPELVYMIDEEGVIMSYAWDESGDRGTAEVSGGEAPSLTTQKDVDFIVVASIGAARRAALFAALEELDAPLLWYVQGHICDMKPEQLLRYIKRSRYLLMGQHERQYFCNTLGLTNIELLLNEGPEAIVVVEYGSAQGSFAYNVFTTEVLSEAHFESLPGHAAHRYRDVMLGFVSGIAFAAREERKLEEVLRTGHACSKTYVEHGEDRARAFDRDTIA